MTTWLLLAAAILCEVAATLSLMGLGVGCVIAGVLLVETGTRHAVVEDVSA